jgi:hypothetical protein
MQCLNPNRIGLGTRRL